jgi:CO/xanthine dehydrogenase FAD-binding subunit
MYALDVCSPHTLELACRALADRNGRPIAGGTDLIPQMRAVRLAVERLVDLSRLHDLRFIKQEDGKLHIGALTTFTAMHTFPLLRERVSALAQAAALVGAVQTRNRGTVGGNIANASPAGDTLPPLLAMDATVTLFSVRGERLVPLAGLLLGPGETLIATDEILHHVSLPCLPAGAQSAYLRLGKRNGQAISIASAAVVLQLDGRERIEDARVALGAAAPTAIRCPECEAVLRGARLSEDLATEAGRIAAQECQPIDDVRATARYRRHVVGQLVRRGVWAASGQDPRGHDD